MQTLLVNRGRPGVMEYSRALLTLPAMLALIVLAAVSCNQSAEMQGEGGNKRERLGGVSDSDAVNIRAISLTVEPAQLQLAKGTSGQVHAVAITFEGDAIDVTDFADWSTENPNLTSVENGMVTGSNIGNDQVSASFQGFSASAEVTVTAAELVELNISPVLEILPIGLTRGFVLSGKFSDGSTQDLSESGSWSTTDAAVASVVSPGQILTVGIGQTLVEASFGGMSATARLQVVDAELARIRVLPADQTIALGTDQAYQAIGDYSNGMSQDLTQDVRWSVSNQALASIGNGGLLQSLSIGSLNVHASYASVSGETQLTISPAALQAILIDPNPLLLPLGLQYGLTATGQFSDGSTQDLTEQVVWKTADAGIATVSNLNGARGQVSSISLGDTQISAGLDAISGSTSVSIIDAVLLSLTVSPASAATPVGMDIQFMAEGIYSDSPTPRDVSESVEWKLKKFNSVNLAQGVEPEPDTIASVSNNQNNKGKVRGLAKGKVKVKAKLSGKSATGDLDVTDAVLVSLEIRPNPANVKQYKTTQLEVYAKYSGSSDHDQLRTSAATWSSADAAVATVSDVLATKGLASGVAKNQVTTITASYGGKTATATINVLDPEYVSVTLDAVEQTLKPLIDLVVVADDSFSMSQHQLNFQNGLTTMLDSMQDADGESIYNLDARIFTTSQDESPRDVWSYTDANGADTAIGYTDRLAHDPHYWTRYYDLALPEARLFSFRTDMSANEVTAEQTDFSNALLVGTNGSDTEMGICKLLRTLQDQGPNKFLDTGKKVAFVLLSDENDATSASSCQANMRYTYEADPNGQTTETCGSDCDNYRYQATINYTYYSGTCTEAYTVDGIPSTRTTQVTYRLYSDADSDLFAPDGGADLACNRPSTAYDANDPEWKRFELMESRKPAGCAGSDISSCSARSYRTSRTITFNGDSFGSYGLASKAEMDNSFCSTPFDYGGTSFTDFDDFVLRHDGYIPVAGTCSLSRSNNVPNPNAFRTSSVVYDSHLPPATTNDPAQAFIDSADAVLGSGNYIFSSIIREPTADSDAGCSGLTAGASYGTRYQTIVNRLGPNYARTVSICGVDYQPAMDQIQTFIETVALSTYDISALSNPEVNAVYIVRNSAETIVASDKWEVQGTSLRFLQDGVVQPGDKIRIEYAVVP